MENDSRRAIWGIGVDIIELRRFRDLAHHILVRVAELVLSGTELAAFGRSKDQAAYLASRFALKEAAIKCYPTALTFRDVRTSKEGVKPVVSTSGPYHVEVSLSHSQDFVVGFAVATSYGVH